MFIKRDTVKPSPDQEQECSWKTDSKLLGLLSTLLCTSVMGRELTSEHFCHRCTQNTVANANAKKKHWHTADMHTSPVTEESSCEFELCQQPDTDMSWHEITDSPSGADVIYVFYCFLLCKNAYTFKFIFFWHKKKAIIQHVMHKRQWNAARTLTLRSFLYLNAYFVSRRLCSWYYN